AAPSDTHCASPSARECGSVGGAFRCVYRPAILDPLPRVAVHIEKSPWIEPEPANRNGAKSGNIAATSSAPWEGRAKICKSGVRTEVDHIIAKAVHRLCTCTGGIFPFGLGRQAIRFAGPATQPAYI